MSHRALSPQQFPLEGLHPSLGGSEVPEVIEGRVASHVFTQAGIRQTPIRQRPKRHYPGTSKDQARVFFKAHPNRIDAPHIATGYEEEHSYGYQPGHEELWTSQEHLHMPTLERYARGDIPVKREAEEWDPHYEPETYRHGGKTWLAEGHHRTVAARLAR